MTGLLPASWRNALPTAIAALGATVIFTPIVWQLTAVAYDYLVHMGITDQLLQTGKIVTPHFLLQLGTILLLPLTGGIFPATIALVLLAVMLTAAVLTGYYRTAGLGPWQTAAAAVATLLVAPVALFYLHDRHLYAGYIGINVFHNPTMFILKPLALLAFGQTVHLLTGEAAPGRRQKIALLLLTIATTLAKPSYTIIVLPATLLYLALYPACRRYDRLATLALTLVLPAAAILAIQYRLTYSQEQVAAVYQNASGVIIAPLLVMGHHSGLLLPKFLLSALFPLAVLGTGFRRAINDPALQLAWLLFGIGSLYSYLLAESGPRLFQGNFCWSGQIGLFLLFTASTRHMLDYAANASSPRKARRLGVCLTIFCLHLAFGIIFYATELLQTQLHW